MLAYSVTTVTNNHKIQNIVQAYSVMTVTYDHKMVIKLSQSSLAYLIQVKILGCSDQ